MISKQIIAKIEICGVIFMGGATDPGAVAERFRRSFGRTCRKEENL